MQGIRPILRGAGRLCAFVFALSILATMAPGSAQAQMCVKFARQLTGFDIQGDAWTWWDHSSGRYRHGSTPEVGSVLVFRRTGRLHSGHVSTVSRVVDRRTILVDHSWLEGYTLHRGMKVVDTSSDNSWTSVRVWYEPTDNIGLRTYPTYGFIYPRGGRDADRQLVMASADMAADADDADVGRDNAPVSGHRMGHAAPAVPASAAAAPVRAAALAPARHRTDTFRQQATRHAAPVAVAEAPAAPRRKPGAAPAHAGVQLTEAPQVAVVPRRKPAGHGAQQVADRGSAELSD
jgi:surface antigen